MSEYVKYVVEFQPVLIHLRKLSMKQNTIFKELCPPIVYRILRRLNRDKTVLLGPYPNWESARLNSSGYNSSTIIERVEAATAEVVAGNATFERDTVLFYSNQFSYPLLVALLRTAAVTGGSLSVMDFGGSLGSTYRQCKPLFDGLTYLHWSIVEQPNFVSLGRRKFQTDILRFHESIQASLEEKNPDAILFSSVLQYLDDPYSIVNEVLNSEAKSIIIDRTPVHDGSEDLFAVQKVPASIYDVSYPARIFQRGAFEASLSPKYRLIMEFDAIDANMTLGNHKVQFKGFLFEINKEVNHELRND